jgi:predicted nucleic acid-binding protein
MPEGHTQTDATRIDVGSTLNEVRVAVRAQRLARGFIEHSPLDQALQRSLDEIELARVVSAHWPLIGKTIPEKVVALFNKLVRRYLRWYINPIVEQQNAYNDAVARMLRLLAEAYADLAKQTNDERRTTNDGRRTTDDGGGITNDEPPTTGYGPRAMNDALQSPISDPSTTPRTSLQSPPTEDEQRTTNDERPITDYKPCAADHEQSPISNLQSLITDQALNEPPAKFPDLDVQAAAPQLLLRQRVHAHWPLHENTLSERAIALVNKLVRRYLRWYINPIVEQQNAANTAISVAVLNIIRIDAERRARIATRRAARYTKKRGLQ